METLWHDIRFALRDLRKTPAVTAIALIALALGIGANTAIFSVIRGVLLKPLPYKDPARLIALIDTNPKIGFPRFSASLPNFADWRQQSRSFDPLVALGQSSYTLAVPGREPERLRGAQVTRGFLDLLGVPLVAGRGFRPDEEKPGAERVAVISQGLWRRVWSSNPALLGKSISLDGQPYTLIGILADADALPPETEVWTALPMQVDEDSRGAHHLQVYGRLKPDVTLEQAQSEMSGICARLEQQHKDSNDGWGVVLHRLPELIVEDIRPALKVLMITVGLVLLIACANVANLLLARMARREREVALRSALGASRGRLLRQMLTESVLLALVGGGLGLLLAAWGTHALVALSGNAIPRSQEIRLDGQVLAFTSALALLTGLVFGLLPAVHASNTDLQATLKSGGRGATGGARTRLLRNGLVFLEVALALVLLVFAGLLLRSFSGLSNVPPGFDPQGVMTMRLALPHARYAKDEQQIAFFANLMRRLRAIPGVSAAGAGTPLPLSGENFVLTFEIEGHHPARPNEAPNANIRLVTNDYLRTLRIPQIDGRGLTDLDDAKAPQVALINQTMAHRLWPKESPIGQRFTFDDSGKPDTKWITVAGIVGDVRASALKTDPASEIYLPISQSGADHASLVVRTAGDPNRLVGPIRTALHDIDAEMPVWRVKTMQQVVADSIAGQRFSTVLLAIFASIAVLLAAVGVYGVISYSVAQRTSEIGVRLALGSSRGGVLGLVVRQGMRPVIAGVVVGLVGAFAGGKILDTFLYGISSRDPLTLCAVPFVLLAIGLLAIYLPGRRATQVDPIEALRSE